MDKKSLIFRSLILSFLIIIFSSCELEKAEENLLSIPLKGSVEVSHTEVTPYIEQIKKFDGTEDIQEVVFRLWRPIFSEARKHITYVREQRDTENILYQITLIFDEIPDDDSIKGFRYDVHIKHEPGKAFSLIKLEESWRCWPDRGHQYFDAQACK